jgi:hypothetical protein
VCVPVYPLIVVRQRFGKNPLIVARNGSVKSPIVAWKRLGRNVTAVKNTHATIEELLDALFSMWPMSYQGRQAIIASYKMLN